VTYRHCEFPNENEFSNNAKHDNKKSNITRSRHCEERSDVAIHKKPTTWIATGYRPRNDGHATCHQQVVSERSRTERSNPDALWGIRSDAFFIHIAFLAPGLLRSSQ
jgi:hypothetical protein